MPYQSAQPLRPFHTLLLSPPQLFRHRCAPGGDWAEEARPSSVGTSYCSPTGTGRAQFPVCMGWSCTDLLSAVLSALGADPRSS